MPTPMLTALLLALAAPAAAQAHARPPAPAAEAPAAPTLKLLLGASEQEARLRLGEPDVARKEAAAAMWTYRRPACALYLYFKEEGGRLRVVGAATGPRRRGDAAPGVDACLATSGAR